MTTTQACLQTWIEARARFSDLLPSLVEGELPKKPINTKNSAGFLIRHIADVELFFAKNVFGSTEIRVQAKTVIASMIPENGQTSLSYWPTSNTLLIT
jgi:hypothetical protein